MYLLHLQAAATHANNDFKYSVTVTWLAPPAGTGAVRFRYFIILRTLSDDLEILIVI